MAFASIAVFGNIKSFLKLYSNEIFFISGVKSNYLYNKKLLYKVIIFLYLNC